MRGRALLASTPGTRDSITDDEVYLVLVRHASTVPIPTVRITSLCRKAYERNLGHRDIYDRLVALEHARRARGLSWANDRSEMSNLGFDPGLLTPRELLARYWVMIS